MFDLFAVFFILGVNMYATLPHIREGIYHAEDYADDGPGATSSEVSFSDDLR